MRSSEACAMPPRLDMRGGARRCWFTPGPDRGPLARTNRAQF